MIKKTNAILFSLAVIPAIVFANAEPLTTTHVVVAPQCLLKQTSLHAKTLASSNNIALIATDEKGIQQLLQAKFAQKTLCGGFMDVTQAWQEMNTHAGVANPKAFLNQYEMGQPKANAKAKEQEYKIQYTKQVKTLLKNVNPQMMWDNLTHLTNYQNRFANSDTGVEASNWIKSQMEKLAADNNRDDIQVYTIKTGSNYKQESVVVKIGKGEGPGIVIGAHMDTIAMFEKRQPGADDDGSGTACVLETARTIISSGMKFKKPIYFAWYSAEEEGLIGSQYVVAQFKKDNIPVEAVLHMDMTGYAYKNDPTMWLITDYVDSKLTNYLETLLNTYVKRPVKRTRCGYACSDHATWTKNGFSSAISFESAFENSNQSIHSSQDTMDKLSQAHMTDYVKLGVAFAVELAEPV